MTKASMPTLKTPWSMPSPHSRHFDRPVLAYSSLGSDISIRNLHLALCFVVCAAIDNVIKVGAQKKGTRATWLSAGRLRRFEEPWSRTVKSAHIPPNKIGYFSVTKRVPQFIVIVQNRRASSLPSWLGESKGVPSSSRSHVSIAARRRGPVTALGDEPRPSARGQIQKD